MLNSNKFLTKLMYDFQIFGPILPIMIVENVDEAIRYINSK